MQHLIFLASHGSGLMRGHHLSNERWILFAIQSKLSNQSIAVRPHDRAGLITRMDGNANRLHY